MSDYGIKLANKGEHNADDKMIEEIRPIVNKYGYSLSCYGPWDRIRLVVLGETVEILRMLDEQL